MLQKQKELHLELQELKAKNPKAYEMHPMHGTEDEPLEIGIKDFGLKKCQWVTVMEQERQEQQQHKRRDFTEAVRNSQRLLPSK